MSNCTIGVLQHHPAEGLGRLTDWAMCHGITLDVRDAQVMFAGPEDCQSLQHQPWDALIILGGPWYLDQAPAWLEAELIAVRDWLQQDRPAFGICLGAQVMAKALGAAVAPLSQTEYGWTEVTLANGANLRVLQWHEQGFSLPAGAASFGFSEHCACQGFKMNNGAQRAVQFHPEWDETSIEHLVAGFGDAVPLPIRQLDVTAHEAIKQWLDRELGDWMASWPKTQ